jgi:hypothetical protein
MIGSLGLETPTIVAKTVEVLDLLVLAGASKDSLSKGLTVWQFPALACSLRNGLGQREPSLLGRPSNWQYCHVLGGRQGDSPSREGAPPPQVGCTPALNLSIGRP